MCVGGSAVYACSTPAQSSLVVDHRVRAAAPTRASEDTTPEAHLTLRLLPVHLQVSHPATRSPSTMVLGRSLLPFMAAPSPELSLPRAGRRVGRRNIYEACMCSYHMAVYRVTVWLVNIDTCERLCC